MCNGGREGREPRSPVEGFPLDFEEAQKKSGPNRSTFFENRHGPFRPTPRPRALSTDPL